MYFEALLVTVSLQFSESRVADFGAGRKTDEILNCVHYDPKKNHSGDKTETCELEKVQGGLVNEHFCFTSWINSSANSSEPGHSSGLRVLKQGCYENHGNAINDCHNHSSCIATDERSRSNGILFCCCSQSNCNMDFIFKQDTKNTTSNSLPVEPPPVARLSTWLLLLYTMVPIFIVFIVILAGCYVFHHRKHAQFNSLSTLGDDTPASPPTAAHIPVNLIEIKARGRFGAVWKGQMMNDMVAVKIFPLQDKQSWLSEQEIYKLPQMVHENILKFMGIQTRGENLQMEFWLVTAFHEQGSLCDFLKGNIINWEDLVKISLSMARGLAHLHGEFSSGADCGVKPAIAHRDFKSKNVLIKSDMTACIGDFGLALQFRPNENVGDTHGQVGTRRYMAPEVLEGAINFSRDAFLRIDMYACGLVLWEIASRCTVVSGPQEYKLPFEAEASPHPSLEEICELVVTKKVRPLLPTSWRAHPGLSVLCETVEECWDHDAEARLSSSCVVERLQLMKHMCSPATQREHNQLITSTYSSCTPTDQVLLIPLNSSSESGVETDRYTSSSVEELTNSI